MTGKKKAMLLGAVIALAVVIAGVVLGIRAQKPTERSAGITQEVKNEIQTDPTEPAEPIRDQGTLQPDTTAFTENTVTEASGAGAEKTMQPAEPSDTETVTDEGENAANADTETAVELTDTPTPAKTGQSENNMPTKATTPAVSKAPTAAVTKTPTKAPTKVPTKAPTTTPAKTAAKTPTKAPTKVATPTPTEFVDPLKGVNWGPQERLVRRTDVEAILFKKVNELRVANGLPPAEDPHDYDIPNTVTGEQYADYHEQECIETAMRNAKICSADHGMNMLGVTKTPFDYNDSAEEIAQTLLDLWCTSSNHYQNLLNDATFGGDEPDGVQCFEFVVYDYCSFLGYDTDQGNHAYHTVAAICGTIVADRNSKIK